MIPIDIKDEVYYGSTTNGLYGTTKFVGIIKLFGPLDTQFRMQLGWALELELKNDF